MKLTVNMLFTCILYCDTGPGCLIRTLASTARCSLSKISYLATCIFDLVQMFFWDAVALLWECCASVKILCLFFVSIWLSLYLLSLMCQSLIYLYLFWVHMIQMKLKVYKSLLIVLCAVHAIVSYCLPLFTFLISSQLSQSRKELKN